MRKPASSTWARMRPIRFRSTASGLTMNSVRFAAFAMVSYFLLRLGVVFALRAGFAGAAFFFFGAAAFRVGAAFFFAGFASFAGFAGFAAAFFFAGAGFFAAGFFIAFASRPGISDGMRAT